MRTLTVGLIALLLAAPALSQERAAPTPPPEDVPIVSGQRIGPITVSMTPQQMVRILGQPERIDRYPERNILSYDWKPSGYLVSFRLDNQRVRVVAVYGAIQGFKTDRNIRLLMPISRAEAAYGKGHGYVRTDCPQDRITLIRYHRLGLQFAAAHDPGKPIHGIIFNIGVFDPAALPEQRVRCATD
ncbi:MAG: hypothetical protein QN163_06305 [Armatimonadota bacterium]|nr:hypothetical protein [Armatimonadota bacterium]MDR5697807.1 hypothetical protein [Armatimonadota bacterium]